MFSASHLIAITRISFALLLLLGCWLLLVQSAAAQTNNPDNERWDSQFNLPGEINGEVNALVLSGTDVYIGGKFTIVGNVKANNLARWNGVAWLPVGGGVEGTVYTLLFQNGELYVGGQLTSAGGVPVNHVAKWNGSNWSAVGSGLAATATVRALAFRGGELYAGGSALELIPNDIASGIVRLNGASWVGVGGGARGAVYAFAVLGNELYVGGEFVQVGGLTVNSIAK